VLHAGRPLDSFTAEERIDARRRGFVWEGRRRRRKGLNDELNHPF
jgi:hypothetical protein